jgi:hypothetical protein
MKLSLILSLSALTALAIPLAAQPARVPLLIAATWLFTQAAILVHTWKHPIRKHATVCVLAVLIAPLAYTAQAQALELGVQDAQAPAEQLNGWATSIGAGWERLTVSVGQSGVAEHIRASHAAGRKVILTVGGNGTQTRRPDFTAALAYITALPRADAYTIDNEPDLDGVAACVYRRGWLKARRQLGRALLFGDFSPYEPLEFTARVKRCGPLPKHLDFALHPYQWTDPLAPGPDEGGIGNLGRVRRALHGMGITVTFWATEFAYLQDISVGRARIVTDARAAWLWPRALTQARRNHVKALVLYTAQGHSWDSRPGVQAWAAIRAAL